MKAKFVNEALGFTEDSDPITDMGIGMTQPEIILDAVLNLFGDKWVVYKNTPEEMKERGQEIKLFTTLPMSSWDWTTLKKETGIKQIPTKYVEKIRDFYGTFKDLHYRALLKDIYGGDWYFDGPDLVQDDRTIVTISGELTLKELIDKIENSPNLISKKRKG